MRGVARGHIKKFSSEAKWFFFFVGLIATIAYRIIIVLNFYDPLWVKISWYIGTMGFILYFYYMYVVQHRESKLAVENDLFNVVEKTNLKGKQKAALEYIVKVSATSKAKWNSLAIFLLSVLALIVGIILDVLGI